MKNVHKNIKLIAINGRYTHSCLALFYVRNEVEKNCPLFSLELHQHTINDNYFEMLLQLSAGNPDYLFFSAAIWNSSLIQSLIIDLQQCLPSCTLVIGGPQAPEFSSMADLGEITIVLGAIESVGPRFYQDLRDGNLGKSYGRSFFSLTERNFSYPYRESDFLEHLQNRHIYYETSRGCPFRCSYCLSAVDRGLFHKNIDMVKKELSNILSYSPKVVRFIDRTFNDIPERALQIWQFLKMHGGNTLFHFEMAPDRFIDEMYELLESLDSGRFQFEIGIQSTNPATLRAVNRDIDVDIARKTVSRLAQTKSVHLHVDLILGLPYETRTSFAQSFRDVFSMGPHYIQMGLLKILPGTPLYQKVKEHGYISCKEPPYAILANRWLDHEQLSYLYWYCECVEKFINNRYFFSLWNYLRQSNEEIFSFFEALLSVCRSGGFFNRAATQELMAEKLVLLASQRTDRDCFIELLQYDWLRCGFRFLPDFLAPENNGKEQPSITRSKLYQSMPAEMSGLYKKNNRNHFFRKSFFLRISVKTLELLGHGDNYLNPCLCVMQEKEGGMFNYNKVAILEG